MNTIEITTALCQIAVPSWNKRALTQSLDQADWNQLITRANQHRLTPIIYDQLNKQGALSALPTPIKENLRTAYLNNAVRNTIFLHEVKQILATFADEQIPTIGLKGVYLLENVYDHIALRTIEDIDFLIHHRDITKAISCLEHRGYHPKTYFEIEDENKDLKHVSPLEKPNRLPVEIHWTIAEENWPFKIDMDGLWERALPVTIAGENALALCVEDLLMHLCLHFTYQHRLRMGLRALYDFVVVLDAFDGQIDWHALAIRANEWRVARIVAMTFRLLEDLLGCAVPQVLYAQLHTDPISRSMLNLAKEQIFPSEEPLQNITPDLAHLSTTRGPLNKAKLVLKRIFIPKNIMARSYNLHPDSIRVYLYYPVRFYQLFRSYGHTAWQILTRRKSVIAGVNREETSQTLHQWMTES